MEDYWSMFWNVKFSTHKNVGDSQVFYSNMRKLNSDLII